LKIINELSISLNTYKKNNAMANLTNIWPFFIVEHFTDSVSFYVDKLGFEIRHIGPDGNPFWAIVGREEISIMLKGIAPGVKPVPNRTIHPWAPWDAYIVTTDPDTLFEEYSSAGVPFSSPLQNNGWLARF
jgi:hypothetical protein